jgi:hypothetical protein
MPSLRVGALNAQYGHAPRAHAEKIIRIFDDEKLDILLITESRDYNIELSDIARDHGYKLVVHRVRRGSDQCTALVRDNNKVKTSRSFRAGRGYFRANGGTMAPMQPIAVKYAGTWFVGVHAPVQAWVATASGRKWIGPLLRRVAYRGFAIKLVQFAKNHPGPIVLIGDWNAAPNTQGKYSPDWIKDQIRGSFIRPFESTGHGEIDFAIRRGVRQRGNMRAYFPKNFPGDHKFIVVNIE